MTGTHQVIADRRERKHTDLEWQTSNRDMAGDMVLGIPEWQAEEEGAGYNTRGEDVRGLREYNDT